MSSKHKKRQIPLLLIAVVLVLIGFFVGHFSYKLNLGSMIPSMSKQGSVQDPIDDQKQKALKEAQKIVGECASDKGGFESCYSKKLADITKNYTLDFALQTLSALQEVDPNSRGCHLMSHYITLAETQKDPSKWKELLGKVDSQSCSGGFVHGVLEARSRLDSTFVLNEQTIPEICGFVGQTHGKGGEFNCSHIMGHILMAENGGKIPDSMNICQQIPEELQYECYSGVFMENMTRDNMIAHGVAERIPWNQQTTQDQQKICQSYSGLAGEACWREISHMYAFISVDDPTYLHKSCNAASTLKEKEDCYFHGVGIITASNRFDLGNMKIVCKPFEGIEDKYQTCIGYVINSLMASSPQFADRAIRFCQDLPEDRKSGCFQRLGDRLGTLVEPTERQKLCSKSPEDYRSLCSGT